MKASELANELIAQVTAHGDFDVIIRDNEGAFRDVELELLEGDPDVGPFYLLQDVFPPGQHDGYMEGDGDDRVEIHEVWGDGKVIALIGGEHSVGVMDLSDAGVEALMADLKNVGGERVDGKEEVDAEGTSEAPDEDQEASS